MKLSPIIMEILSAFTSISLSIYFYYHFLRYDFIWQWIYLISAILGIVAIGMLIFGYVILIIGDWGDPFWEKPNPPQTNKNNNQEK